MTRHRPTSPNTDHSGTFRASTPSKDQLLVRSEEPDLNSKLRVLTAALGVTLVMVTASACGSGSAASASSPSEVVGDAAQPSDIADAEAGIDPTAEKTQEQLAKEGGYSIEGSVTTTDGKFVEYPDGFRITFVKAENRPDAKPAFDGDYVKDRVRFTLLLENNGSSAVAIDPGAPFTPVVPIMTATGGINQFDLQYDTGFMGETEARNQLPRRLSPGTSLMVYESFNIPQDKRDAITVTVNSGEEYVFTSSSPSMRDRSYSRFTFTDVHTLLKK